MNRRRRLIFFIVYIAYTSTYIARLNLSIAGPELLANNVMSAAQMGMLGSVFSSMFALGRLLNGALSDKKAPYVMICTGLIVSGISNICFGFFPPFVAIFIIWAANAYAQSMLWSSVLCIVASIYDEKSAKKMNSYMVTSVATGNILGILINSFIIVHIGVKYAFIIPGAITLILSTFVFFTTRTIVPAQAKKQSASLFRLFKNKQIQLTVVPALMHGVMKENISLWMTVFIVDVFAIDLSKSSYFVLFIPLVGFVGRFLYPAMHKLCRENEFRVALYAFACCVFLALILCIKTSPIMAIVCLSLIYSAVSMINTAIVSVYPVRYANMGNVASVSGLLDFATYLGSGISSVIYGIVIGRVGYAPMFVSWSVISLISIAVLAVLIKKNKREGAPR